MRICVVALCLLLACCYTRLVVYNPRQMRNEINSLTGEIKSSLANFGLVQYGHSVVGRVWYDDENADGCGEYTISIDGSGDPDAVPSPMVLVNRGNCSFVQKVRNVEHAGGRVAIVIDDRVEEDVENVVMVDDGSGNGIRIPAVMIGKKDGNIILKYLKEEKTGKHTNPYVSLVAIFDITHPDNRVEWDFWYTSSNDRAINFLKGYKEFHLKLGKNTLFTPHFKFWNWENWDNNQKKNDCFSNGKYCAIEGLKGIKGTEILYENLRQKCLYDKLMKDDNEAMWWEYVLKAHAKCYGAINEDCSEQVHTQLKLDFKQTKKWVQESFIGDDHSIAENTYFKKEDEYYSKYGPQFFPAAVINNITYRGTLDPANFFDAICEGFKDRPEQCGIFGGVKRVVDEGINTTTLLLIIIGLVIVNVVIIICYKRYAKKEMDKNIEMHINSAVSQYFALQDKGNSRTSKPSVY